jgi:cytidine deaminase
MNSKSYCDISATGNIVMDNLSKVIDANDRKLIDIAIDALRKNFDPLRHQVGAALLCASGKTYQGINIEACGYGPCAEPIAIGAALTQGERQFISIVAVCKETDEGDNYIVLSPCGNCRQLLLDYAPECTVILSDEGKVVKTKAKNLLIYAYRTQFS